MDNKTFKMLCPVHNTSIVGRFYTISRNGLSTEYPLSYCPTCKCAYSSKKYEYLNVTAKGLKTFFLDVHTYDKLQIADKPVVNKPTAKAAINNKEDNLLKFSEIYLVDGKTKRCPQCGSGLYGKLNQAQNQSGKLKKIVGLHCPKCNRFFVNINNWMSLTKNSQYQLDVHYDFIEDNIDSTRNTEAPSAPIVQKIENKMHKEALRNDTNEVLSVKNIDFSNNRICYEDIEPLLLSEHIVWRLIYSIMFRRFDKTEQLLKAIEQNKIKALVSVECDINKLKVNLAKCIKWNAPYICAYDEKNNTDIAERFKGVIGNEDDEFPVFEYDAKTIFDKSVFQAFFNGIQPMLDVKYFKKQTTASKQVKNNGVCLVADEVGTGKTVSALYAIRDIISEQETKGRAAHILIVCPRNKKSDWQSDIRRQLGRYAHIVEQSDNGLLYNEELKNAFFRSYEHKIFICGPTRGKDKNGNRSSLKGSLERWNRNTPWHLAVVDEGHILFNNYSNIRAERCMIMTATPIVVNSTGIINFNNYISLLCRITSQNIRTRIDPITCNIPSENETFTNWFREDMGLSSAKRKISFENCVRHELMLDVFYQIAEQKGTLTALHYVQDDEYLFKIAREKYELIGLPKTVVNHKLNRLVDILKRNDKSYIVFCEHVDIMDNIYENLRNSFSTTVIASKNGTTEKVSIIEKTGNGQLINTLTQELRAKKRVILIATGKTGGTGLNLGEFDGVIHYELPFTSIELEQRYGRVDRMDKTDTGTEKDMIFMLNACGENEDDFEINRMLHYCTRKIDATCKYMPIRNTVLFYPEFIQRNTSKILEALIILQAETLLSEANEDKMKALLRKRSSYNGKISKISAWKSIRAEYKNLSPFEVCENLLRHEKRTDITDEQYAIIREFVEFEKNNQTDFENYAKATKRFREHKKICEQWLGILGTTELSDDSVFVKMKDKGIDFDNEYSDADSEFSVEEQTEEDKEDAFIPNDCDEEKPSMLQQIGNLADEVGKVGKSTLTNLELSNRLSDGIFWYEDRRIKRATVAEYRALGVGK